VLVASWALYGQKISIDDSGGPSLAARQQRCRSTALSSKREQQYVFFARIRILRFFQISKNVTVYVFLK